MSTRIRPDILLIVLDTLRADRLSCYGYPRQTSPHIDAFAEDGLLFERAISPAQWTIPAHASLFTGEYPSTHMTTQTYDRHSEDQPTLAELLRRGGYRTVSFCNNPLLSVVDNELERGFEERYNYCSALPERPTIIDTRTSSLGRIAQGVSRLIRRATFPIQSLFANSGPLLQLVWHPRIRSLWRGHLNVKGNTVQSLRDVVGYLRARERKGAERPLFAFINLMETHLPYAPAPRFIRKFAPCYRRNDAARDFMRSYNSDQHRWMLPLVDPLTELQDRVLNDLYDAEIAYEDHLLRPLFAHLNQPRVRDNTLVIVTADHGEGLNNHGFVGHSLVAYEDLVHVPLIVRCPRWYPEGKRTPKTVSVRRVFHTVLEAAGIPASTDLLTAVQDLSLGRVAEGTASSEEAVLTEAYPSERLITLMENKDPELTRPFRYRQIRQAIYKGDYKLITVGGELDELFDVIEDPDELCNLIEEKPQVAVELGDLLARLLREAKARCPRTWESKRQPPGEELMVTERLRALGYIE